MRILMLSAIVTAVVLLVGAAVQADVEKGRTAYERDDYARALFVWKPLAERGERDAQLWLGVLYEKGQGVTRDLAEAHKWYALAWKRDHPEARKRTLALRKRMPKQQFEDSKRRIRAWIKAFAPIAPDGVTGPARGGLALIQKEISREKIKGVTHVCYRIDATGLPPRGTYRVWMRDLGMSIDGEPELALSTGGIDIRKMNFCFKEFRKGEWSRIKVTSFDGTILARTTFVPFPLEARQGRCRIWLEPMEKTGWYFLAEGEGFEPNEELTTVSRSNGEVLRSKSQADAEGKLYVVLAPAAVKRQYKSSWSVIRKSGVTLTVHYEWGRLARQVQ